MSGQKYTSVEMLAALYAVAWGLFIANPLIDSFPRYPNLYKPMLQIVEYESFWGAVASLTGGVAIYFIVKDKKQASAAIVGFMFLAFACLFVVGDLTSPAFILFGLIAIFNLIHWRTLKWKTSQSGSNG